jgi:hypothetical protein
MTISANRVAKRVISQLDDIGINSKVGTVDSHTAELVKLIVNEVLNEIRSNGYVLITDANAITSLGPAPVIGKGTIL